jgi:tRNA nucleotidyltransferase (CCA-adding enzyme)
LPSNLTALLAKEAFREELIEHYDKASNHLEERCAITLMGLPASEIRSWANAIRMPIEVRDFSEIFSDLGRLVNQYPDGLYPAVDVLAWFNRADIWRKPDRGQMLLDLAKRLGFKVSVLIAAMRHAQALSTADIISGVAAEDRSNGERIGSAFESARLAAITSALLSLAN